MTSGGESQSVVTLAKTSGFCSEDWCSIGLGWIVLLAALAATRLSTPADAPQRVVEYHELTAQLDALEAGAQPDPKAVKALRAERKAQLGSLAANPLKPWIAKLGSWDENPRLAFVDKQQHSVVPGVLGVFLVSLLLFAAGLAVMGQPVRTFPLAFAGVFLLAVLAYVLAGQNVVKHYNLEYALWALVVGLVISNTLGTPRLLAPAIQTELYIKTGLVLLGAEILFNRLLALGVPGICVSWVVTPVVLVGTYIFGQKVLRMPSRSLNMVICADMSVCGVSAAIAAAAACRAKKEELSLAIGLSLAFTVIMMVVMPLAIQWCGMNPVMAGAWIGGTIDSTGAVAAAGAILGDTALAVAATVKMIQNILIGVIAFGIAVYWVSCVERTSDGPRPSWLEIWRRFPKFVLGFLAASVAFSAISSTGPQGQALTAAAIADTSEVLRGWFFCLAFVSIGLDTNIAALERFFVGGKPLILYICGQTLNLVLSLAMVWLMFEKVFPGAAAALEK
ncbi:MAG TPA: putative sulfate exporter family transporter [Pirellulales bacterium]|nr:putative sulfate exporter family transporter [Pirellulales bacterium]